MFLLIIISLIFKAITQWFMARYINMLNYSISSRLLRGYLGRPYSFFLNRNSADLGKTLLSEVGQVVNNVLLPGVHLVANLVVALFLVAVIIAVNPSVAITAALFIGGVYSIIYIALRRYLSRIGAERIRVNLERFQIAQEALGGIKDVKVLGLENGYIRTFSRPAFRFAEVQANSQIIKQIPQFVLQGLVIAECWCCCCCY